MPLQVLARLQSLFSISTFECLTHRLCVFWLQTDIAHCIQSGFLLLQKEAKTREWKAVKNILKVNSIENKIISASFLCKGGQLAKLNSNCSRGWGNWVGGGGGLVEAGFDQEDNKCMTSIGINCLVISFVL